MIARGLATNARLLVLDEPTASLTDEEIGHLHDVLRTAARRGRRRSSTSRTGSRRSTTSRTTSPSCATAGWSSSHPPAKVERSELIEHITGPARPRKAERWQPPRGRRRRGRSCCGSRGSAARRRRGRELLVRAGDVLGIAGLVGAGRTELVRLIFGADRPTSGRILVRGPAGDGSAARATRCRPGSCCCPRTGRTRAPCTRSRCARTSRCRRCGGSGTARSLPLPSRARERRASQDLIERLQIKVPDLESPIGNLSGGNQQKVVLAKWLESGANVLIFDEPTHGIDVGAKEEIYQLMVDLAAAGKGVDLHLLRVPRARRHLQPRRRDARGPARGRVRGRLTITRVGARRELLRGVSGTSRRANIRRRTSVRP